MPSVGQPCGVCGVILAFVQSPGLPTGATFGSWQGWFHLQETSCKHFANVGWSQLVIPDKPHRTVPDA